MDQKLDQAKYTGNWAFWDLEPPTIDDEEASRIPVRTASDQPEDEREDVCIFCEIKSLQESSENLSAEIYDLTNTVEHLIRMLGGK